MNFYEIVKKLKELVCYENPDFTKLEALLANGLDINMHTNDKEQCEQETLLSWVISEYEMLDESIVEIPAVVDVVRFFLEHGYDVHANDEFNGIVVLDKFAYSPFCDKYSIEAVKLLMKQSPDVEKRMYPEEAYTSIHDIVIDHDWDNRNHYECRMDIANYYYAFERVISCKQDGKNYSQVFHQDFAIGKKIFGIYALGGLECLDSYEGTHYDTEFSQINLDCEGYNLNISAGHSLIIEPPQQGEYVDISELFPEYIGATIVAIEYSYSKIRDYGGEVGKCHIRLDNGNTLTIGEDYLTGPEPNKWFNYIEVK